MTFSIPRSDGGPLSGLIVVELAGLGPAPFCGMVLADHGATVIRVDRPGGDRTPLLGSGSADLLNRGKLSVVVDLKQDAGVAIVLRMAAEADALIEGFRPGVVERLGLGPAAALARNRGLVYGRMTGWGRGGPLSATAGHDIDYIAVSGVLGAIGAENPSVPLNLIGDFGGGGMMLAFGLLAGVISARRTGEGQVVDSAMVDGSALLATSHHGFLAEGSWTTQRQANLLDGGAPFYAVYPTLDGEHMAVGALEPQFFAALLQGLGIDPDDVGSQMAREGWPAMREKFTIAFGSKTRAEWERSFAGSDACVAPVLSLTEAPQHPHNIARGSFVDVDGVTQPAPSPRFSATPSPHPGTPSSAGDNTDVVMSWLGYSEPEIGKLRSQSVIH